MTDDDPENPFEQLGDPDREGDPFERLGDDSEGSTPADPSEGEDDGGEQQDASDPFAGLDREPGGSGAASGPPTEDENAIEAGEDGGATTPDPFGGMGERSGDPFSGGDNVFEQVDVGSVEADEVWSSITGEGEEGEEPTAPEESRYATVSKHSFCEQCKYFSEPPDAHCTNETAEIIEYVDMEQVRLLDCPIVAERQELE